MREDRRIRSGEFPARQLVFAWLTVCTILLLANATRLWSGRLPDPDDTLRLVQVRDLLAGQHWFDTTQYRIDPPAGTAMHWSRLVDLPLYLAIAALDPVIGQANAERVTLVAAPFLTLGVAAAAIGRLAWRKLGARVAIFAVLACGFLPSLLFQFQPMRIDHHGWQIVAIAIALLAIGRRDPRSGGWIAGLALAFGLSISIELLPIAAGFALVLFSRWWFNQENRTWLVSYLQALSLVLLGIYLVTRGPSASSYCDAISPAHLLFFVVAAGGTWIVGRFASLTRLGLVLMFALVGIVSLGSFALVSPDCLTTPFATLDPVVDKYWYRLVLEGQPLWLQREATYVPALIQFAAAIGATLMLLAHSHDWMRIWWAEYLFVLLVSLALGLLVARSLALASIIAAIPLGWLASVLLDRLRLRGNLFAKIGIALSMIILLVPMALVTPFKALWSSPAAGSRSVASAQCDVYENAPRLAALRRGIIFAPLDMGPAILLGTEHSVVATGHHRAANAMKDVIDVFTSGANDARTVVAAHRADYLVLCTDMAEVAIYSANAPAGLAAQIKSGKIPDWLQPIDVGGPAEFAVFRVVD